MSSSVSGGRCLIKENLCKTNWIHQYSNGNIHLASFPGLPWFALTILIHRSRKAAKAGKVWETSGGGKVGGVP